MKLNDDLEVKKELLKSELKSRGIDLEPIYYETKLICGMTRNELLKIMKGKSVD